MEQRHLVESSEHDFQWGKVPKCPFQNIILQFFLWNWAKSVSYITYSIFFIFLSLMLTIKKRFFYILRFFVHFASPCKRISRPFWSIRIVNPGTILHTLTWICIINPPSLIAAEQSMRGLPLPTKNTWLSRNKKWKLGS